MVLIVSAYKPKMTLRFFSVLSFSELYFKILENCGISRMMRDWSKELILLNQLKKKKIAIYFVFIYLYLPSLVELQGEG